MLISSSAQKLACTCWTVADTEKVGIFRVLLPDVVSYLLLQFFMLCLFRCLFSVFQLISRRRFQQIDVLEGINVLISISGKKLSFQALSSAINAHDGGARFLIWSMAYVGDNH